jgi:dihydropteroate synthase
MVKLVGILNVTPDSFSDGGEFFSPTDAIERAARLFNDGASLVDVGAESTRPNAAKLTSSEEWDRLEPVLKALLPQYPGKISVDSYRPETIRRAYEIGPVIINDVTGMNNPDMVSLAAELKPTLVISHLPGANIQEAHRLTPVGSVDQVKGDLLEKARILEGRGLERMQIILDPGIGFGKTMALNAELLEFARHVPEYQVMIGYSRKRFLGQNRMELEPNIEAGRIAIANGAAFLRVHDVAGHVHLINS